MFLTIVRIFPSAEDREAVREFLVNVLGPTRVQPGCLDCTLAMDSDSDALLYMETWESKDDLLRRMQSDAYGKILATMELSAKKPEVCVYEVVNQQGLELIESVRMAPQGEGGAGH
jgi:quinol monooxygenase YgiN